ncbi:hypothetical protein D1007_43716 [Hordeum vulgare]|nr:hypothetical protein D1007_43716 [Hordeum vulgare]
MDFVRGLGVDEVLDYRTPKGAALRGPSGRRYNAVADVTPGVGAALTSILQKATIAKKRLAPLMLLAVEITDDVGTVV